MVTDMDLKEGKVDCREREKEREKNRGRERKSEIEVERERGIERELWRCSLQVHRRRGS